MYIYMIRIYIYICVPWISYACMQPVWNPGSCDVFIWMGLKIGLKIYMGSVGSLTSTNGESNPCCVWPQWDQTRPSIV
jgi:hypothetical protein